MQAGKYAFKLVLMLTALMSIGQADAGPLMGRSASLSLQVRNDETAPASGMDAPMQGEKIYLGKMLGCTPDGAGTEQACSVRRGGNMLEMWSSKVDKTIETLIFYAPIAVYSRHTRGWEKNHPDSQGKRIHRAEKKNREMAIRIVHHFLPEWKEEREWMEKALDDVLRFRFDTGKRNEIKVGGITVIVKGVAVVDTPNIYAEVVLTKEPALDKWKWEGKDNAASEENLPADTRKPDSPSEKVEGVEVGPAR